MFGQYRGMRRELYILFWGKAATNMGAMIWPMLTLILSNKLGMNAQEIAKITIAMGVVQFPANLLGGKLADCCNKKKAHHYLRFGNGHLLPDSSGSSCIHGTDPAVFYSRNLSDNGKSVL